MKPRNRLKKLAIAPLLFVLAAPAAAAQERSILPPEGWAGDPPDVNALIAFDRVQSPLRTTITRYLQDKAAIERRYPVHYSPVRTERLRAFHNDWSDKLAEADFDSLDQEGRIDYLMLRNRIVYNLEMLALQEQRWRDMAALIPFFDRLRALEETRLDRQRAEPRAAAATLDAIASEATALAEAVRLDSRQRNLLVNRATVSKSDALRAADQLDHLRGILANFNRFYDGFDPLYTFWAGNAYESADNALHAYAETLRGFLTQGGEDGKAPIFGDPVRAEGLRADLAVEMIPYEPAELIEMGRKEFAWVKSEMKRVAADMGYGDDWRAALEHTKDLAPPPGEAPWAIFEIAEYEESYVDALNVVTLPPLAREVWRLKMSSPELQLRNPFFQGGEETSLAYPEITMSYQDKVMSMRGNTPPFNFPTVQHELIPGHHLQKFMYDRFNSHRADLNWTPFWIEGWALYWELDLWDRADFPRNNAERMGMLFWRLHRAGRIVFSLNYQLGRWTPEQCVDFLVNEVGHERANAEAEVRRTTIDAPLYQISYMIGAMQLRALHHELVASGQVTEKEFHDGFLIGGPMPIELFRALLSNEPLTRDYQSQWRFYDTMP